MNEQNNLQPVVSMKNSKRLWIIFIVVIAVSLITAGGVYAWQKRGVESASPKTIEVFEAYDCDKLRVVNVVVPEGKSPVDVALEHLPGPGGISTVAQYAKSFKVVEGNIAYIDWPAEMANLSNIDTSCALQAFLQPIEKTLTQIVPINTVIHSLGGSVNAFYMRMGLSCPTGIAECNYDAVYIPVDKAFKITNIGTPNFLGNPVTSVFPIYAYMCDTYGMKDGVPLRYSKIDFFISKEAISAPAILLGTTPSGSAGSGECDLLEDESSLKSNLEPGKYRIWAVRYIDNRPDKRTVDNYISVINLDKPIKTSSYVN